MSSRSRAAAAACLLLMVATGLGAAPEPAGEIVYRSGAAEVLRASGRAPLAQGDPVFAGDSLFTGGDGRVEVRFTDQGKVSLAPVSHFIIESYVDAQTPPAQKPLTVQATPSVAAFRFVKGGFRALTGLIGKRNPPAYKMEVPGATIGVRGTEFSGQLCEQACDGNPAGLYVAVHEGAIELRNEAGTIELEAGDLGFVSDSGEAPREVEAEGLDKLFDAAGDEVAEADAEDRELEDEEEDWEEQDERNCLVPRLLRGIRP